MTPYREAQFDAPTSVERRWGLAAVAMVLFVVGMKLRLPVPGATAIARALGEHAWAVRFYEDLTVEDPAWVALLFAVRGALALATHGGEELRRRRWYAITAVSFAACCALIDGARFIDHLLPRLIARESASGAGRFLAALMVARFVASAALWGLASMVTRSRVAHGPSLFLSTLVAGSLLDDTWRYSRALGEGGATPDVSFTGLAFALTVALLLVLRRSTPTTWPWRAVRNIEAYSALDLLLLPLLVAGLASAAWELLTALIPGSHARNDASVHAAVAAGGLTVAWLAKRIAATPSQRSKGSARAAIALLASLVLVALSGFAHGAGGVRVAWSWLRSPMTRWHVVTLRAERPTAAHDAPLIARRLIRVGHRAEVLRAEGAQITLRVALSGGDVRETAIWAARPGRVTLQALSPVQLEGLFAIDTYPRSEAGAQAADFETVSRFASDQRIPCMSEPVARVGCVDRARGRDCFALRVDPWATLDLSGDRPPAVPFRGGDSTMLLRVPLTPAQVAALSGVETGLRAAFELDGFVVNVPDTRVVVQPSSIVVRVGPPSAGYAAEWNARHVGVITSVGPLDSAWRVTTPATSSR